MSRPPATTKADPLDTIIPEEAFAPAVYSINEYAALQALHRGEANQLQQQAVLKWIVEQVSRYYDIPFRPGGEDGRRATDFACGRAFVGQQLVKILKSGPPKSKKGQDDGQRPDQR